MFVDRGLDRGRSSPDLSLTERLSCEESRAQNFRPSLPTLMSSTTSSSANFQSIFDVALDSYSKQTGIDLTKHPSADKLQNCRSSDDVFQILSERESAFKDYRDQHRNLIDCLRPVVQVVHAFSAVFGEVASLVR